MVPLTGGSLASFIIDTVAPTVSMVRADGATTTLTGVFNVNVTFSEDVTDFVAADVTVDQSATVAVVSGTTDAYVVSVTPATGTDATLSISIAGG